MYFGTSLFIGSGPASSIVIQVCRKWKLLQVDFCIAQVVLAHKAPVIHPVIHFQAIPDAINTVSEQTSHFSSQARLYGMGKWRGFVMLYQFMFFRLPVFILLIYFENLSVRWASLMCQGLFDNTNSCTEYAYTVKGEILTGAEFW